VAADFDGDGDIDLVIAPEGKEGWEYYERREDGSLEELLEDSPFPDSLWKRVLPSTLTDLGQNRLCRPVFHVGRLEWRWRYGPGGGRCKEGVVAFEQTLLELPRVQWRR